MYSIIYAGERKPHMLWEEFESRLTVEFSVFDEHEGR